MPTRPRPLDPPFVASRVALGVATLVAALVGCGPGDQTGLGSQGNGPSESMGNNGGNGGGATRAGAWLGATRAFGAAVPLSIDATSRVVGPLFLPGAPAGAVVVEPGVPDLVFSRADRAGSRLQLDSSALPVNGALPQAVIPSVDLSCAVVLYWSGSGAAAQPVASFIGSSGTATGPSALGSNGFSTAAWPAAVALPGGAGAVLLGPDPRGQLTWASFTTSGLGAAAPIATGIAPDAAQPERPTLWDDGTGALTALVPQEYGGGANRTVVALRGQGVPFAFGAPMRLDTLQPGGVQGYSLTLGPKGEAGVFVALGVPGGAATLVGLRIDAGGARGGYVVPPSTPVPALSPPADFAWQSCRRSRSLGSGAKAGCDPALRFATNGDLLALWTGSGGLSFARLPAGTAGWTAPVILADGPLESGVAVDGAGDASAVVGSPNGPALLDWPAGGSPTVTVWPQAQPDRGLAFLGADAASGGAWFAGQSGSPQLLSWGYAPAGPGSPVSSGLPAGELPIAARLAAPSLPSSTAPAFFGSAAPGLLAALAEVPSQPPRDLLVAAYGVTGAIHAFASAAAPGWQSTAKGVLGAELRVDPAGEGLLLSTQQIPGQGTREGAYVSFVTSPGLPSVPCLPAPEATSVPSFATDQLPFGPKALTGGGRIEILYDQPATAVLAR